MAGPRLAPIVRQGRIRSEIRSEHSKYKHANPFEKVIILESIARLEQELFQVLSIAETPETAGTSIDQYIKSIEAARAASKGGANAKPLVKSLVEDIQVYIERNRDRLGSVWVDNVWNRVTSALASNAGEVVLQLELGINQYESCVKICSRGNFNDILSNKAHTSCTVAEQTLIKAISKAKNGPLNTRLGDKVTKAEKAIRDLQEGFHVGVAALKSIREAEQYAYEKKHSDANTEIAMDKYRDAKSFKELFEDYIATRGSRFTELYKMVDTRLSGIHQEMQKRKQQAESKVKQERERREKEEKEKEEAEKKIQEEEEKRIREITDAIRKKSKGTSWQEFIRYLYDNHSPKRSTNRQELERHISSNDTEKVFNRAMTDYHPDRNSSYGKRWKSMCSEIYKCLNMLKATN